MSGRLFGLRAGSNALPNARLGLIAGRKAARRAVDRNRAKRLARAIFQALRPGLPALDIVLQLKSDLRKSRNAEIRAELERLIAGAAARFGGAPDTRTHKVR